MDRGVVLTEVGRFGLEPIEVDEPGEHEVLVRIEASGVCRSDLHVVETSWAHRLPVLLGHEAAGVVDAVGPASRACARASAWCSAGALRAAAAAGAPAATRAAAARLRARRDGCAAGRPALSQTLQLGTFATRTVVHEAAAIPSPATCRPSRRA